MSVLTEEVLKSIGFNMPSEYGGIRNNIGNFELTATFGYGDRFSLGQNWHILGILSTSRTLGYLEFEMPEVVESWEQGVAWVTWHLDKYSANHIINPTVPVAWLTEGRNNFHLLPWERERSSYAAEQELFAVRPHCYVQRDWTRGALKRLAELAAILDDIDLISFDFDGEIIRIRCADELIAAPAQGKAWVDRYFVESKKMRERPKRLMSDPVCISIWKEKLVIDRYRYSTVNELPRDLNDRPELL